jgi:hypothetical protein
LVIESGEREHWIAELLEWLDEIAEIRLKPDHRPGAKSFYYRIMFDEPFGGAEACARGVSTEQIETMIRGFAGPG